MNKNTEDKLTFKLDLIWIVKDVRKDNQWSLDHKIFLYGQ